MIKFGDEGDGWREQILKRSSNVFWAQERGIMTASLILGHVTVAHGYEIEKPGCASAACACTNRSLH